MDERLPIRHRVVLLFLSVAIGACSTADTIADVLEDFDAPVDTLEWPEAHGQLVAVGVGRGQNPLQRATWAFVGSDIQIVYGTNRPDGSEVLWYRDITQPAPVEILSGIDALQTLSYAPATDRVYVAEWPNLRSLRPTGEDLVTHSTDAGSMLRVSPNGRFLYHDRASDGIGILIDHLTSDTLELELPGLNARFYDDFAVHFGSPGATRHRLGILDLVTRESDWLEGPGMVQDWRLVGFGGPRSSPWLRFVDLLQEDGILRFLSVDLATRTWTDSEEYVVSGQLGGIPWNSIDAVASPDGDMIAISVTRVQCVLSCTQRYGWELLVLDTASREVRPVATGRSSESRRPLGMVFSPGRERILYEVDSELYVVDLP